MIQTHAKITTHQPFQANPAKIELDACPGTLLGGPLTTQRHANCERVSESQLAERHLEYLRHAYQHDPQVRRKLQGHAASYRYGRNHLAVLTPYPAIGENVIKAIQGVAERLPYRADFEPAPALN